VSGQRKFTSGGCGQGKESQKTLRGGNGKPIGKVGERCELISNRGPVKKESEFLMNIYGLENASWISLASHCSTSIPHATLPTNLYLQDLDF